MTTKYEGGPAIVSLCARCLIVLPTGLGSEVVGIPEGVSVSDIIPPVPCPNCESDTLLRSNRIECFVTEEDYQKILSSGVL